jgi:hypothetical protein
MDDTHRSTIFILIAGIGLIGLTPVLAVAAWITRGRARTGDAERLPARRGPAIVMLAVLVTAVFGTAWYLSGRAQPARDSAVAMGGSMPMEGSAATGGSSATSEPATPALPGRLVGLPLSSSASGSEALRQVASMHSGSFQLSWAAIGGYGSGEAMVWVAAPADGTAAEMATLMAERISQGGSPFAAPEPVRGDPRVWATTGIGKVHFFWATDEAVWWLSADRGLAEEALAQLRRKGDAA